MKNVQKSITLDTIFALSQQKRPIIVPLFKDDHTIYFEHGEKFLSSTTSPSPCKSEVNIFAYIVHGSISLTISGNTIHAHEQQGVVCPAGSLISDLQVSDCSEIHLLCISAQRLNAMLHDKLGDWYRMVYIGHNNLLDLSAHDTSLAVAFYKNLLHFRAEHQQFVYSNDVISLLIESIITDICSLLATDTPSVASNTTAERLFGQFIALLTSTLQKHQPVQYYADQLCISAKYLSRICIKQSGRTAAHWIEQAVCEDIRRSLSNPTLSNKEIADLLGFNSTSFFGRYVREHFGCTPTTMRKKISTRK